jgi:hypothetical protein
MKPREESASFIGLRGAQLERGQESTPELHRPCENSCRAPCRALEGFGLEARTAFPVLFRFWRGSALGGWRDVQPVPDHLQAGGISRLQLAAGWPSMARSCPTLRRLTACGIRLTRSPQTWQKGVSTGEPLRPSRPWREAIQAGDQPAHIKCTSAVGPTLASRLSVRAAGVS